MLKVDHHKCNADELCVAVCPVGAVQLNGEGGKADIDADQCIECYACKEICPQEAISESDT